MPAIVSWLLLVWAAFFAPFVDPLILRAVGAVVAVEAGAALVPEPDPRIGGDLEPTLEDLYPNFLSPAATKLLTAADEALLRRELAAVRDAEADARDGRLGDALRALAARAESSYGREVAALHLGQRAAERGDWEEALRQARRERAALASPDAGRALQPSSLTKTPAASPGLLSANCGTSPAPASRLQAWRLARG